MKQAKKSLITAQEFQANVRHKSRKKQEEHELQKGCVKWFRLQYPKLQKLLFAIPNGARLAGNNRVERAKEWNKLKAEGAVQGAADLFLSIPSGDLAGLYIEMKTPKGKQSKEQQAFEQAVVQQGYGYAMPKSFFEFERVIKSYLKSGEY